MTTKTDEQERADFEAWYRQHHGDRDVYVLDDSGEYVDKQVQGAFNVWQARAALQSQDDISKLVKRLREADKPLMQQNTFSEVRALLREAAEALQSRDREGWKEATIAWEVCASLHREYCKGKDPFYKTRQADFVKHAEVSREKALSPYSTEDKTDVE